MPHYSEQLEALYRQHWANIYANLPRDQGFSVPFLGSSTKAYEDSRCRLVLVGQQTRGWCTETEGPWSERHADPYPLRVCLSPPNRGTLSLLRLPD